LPPRSPEPAVPPVAADPPLPTVPPVASAPPLPTAPPVEPGLLLPPVPAVVFEPPLPMVPPEPVAGWPPDPLPPVEVVAPPLPGEPDDPGSFEAQATANNVAAKPTANAQRSCIAPYMSLSVVSFVRAPRVAACPW